MKQALCSISAFRYYRIPPQFIPLLANLDVSSNIGKQKKLSQKGLVQLCLKTPLHFIREDHRRGRSTTNVVKHYWKGKFLRESIVEKPAAGLITSPEFTLFTLAKSVSLIRLIMAMYEMCGNFAVFKPDARLEQALASRELNKGKGDVLSWRRVVNKSSGKASNLWMRKPLVTLESLQKFADKTAHHHGNKQFKRALSCVTGICSSPFEVQASMLLGLPRFLGGEALPLKNNFLLEFEGDSRTLSRHERCYADIFMEGKGGRNLVIECQGALVHDNLFSLINDSERATALDAQGYKPILLTYGQIANRDKFEVVAEHIKKELGVRGETKSLRFLEAKIKLRQEIFSDWDELI